MAGYISRIKPSKSAKSTCEHEVDGVTAHVLVGEHKDVEQVKEGPQHAHRHRQIAVDWGVPVLKKYYFNNQIMNVLDLFIP